MENKIKKEMQDAPLDLGRKVEAPAHYAPEMLRRVARTDERKKLLDQFQVPVLPFFGYDVWNCYEFNFLNMQGIPHNYVLRIIYSCLSAYIVESKSLKLYLGSFSMDKFQSIEEVLDLIERDLTNLLGTPVSINATVVQSRQCVDVVGLPLPFGTIDLDTFKVPKGVQFNCYQHNPLILELDKSPISNELTVVTSSLKSNCKITHQPDYGTLMVRIKGDKLPTVQSLYEYIVSFREENHFHEEIVETIFTDLYFGFKPKFLEVFAQYTRRGGIDINPVRYLNLEGAFKNSALLYLLESNSGLGRSFMQ